MSQAAPHGKKSNHGGRKRRVNWLKVWKKVEHDNKRFIFVLKLQRTDDQMNTDVMQVFSFECTDREFDAVGWHAFGIWFCLVSDIFATYLEFTFGF